MIREHASVLRYTYIACLVMIWFIWVGSKFFLDRSILKMEASRDVDNGVPIDTARHLRRLESAAPPREP